MKFAVGHRSKSKENKKKKKTAKKSVCVSRMCLALFHVRASDGDENILCFYSLWRLRLSSLISIFIISSHCFASLLCTLPFHIIHSQWSSHFIRPMSMKCNAEWHRCRRNEELLIAYWRTLDKCKWARKCSSAIPFHSILSFASCVFLYFVMFGASPAPVRENKEYFRLFLWIFDDAWRCFTVTMSKSFFALSKFIWFFRFFSFICRFTASRHIAKLLHFRRIRWDVHNPMNLRGNRCNRRHSREWVELNSIPFNLAIRRRLFSTFLFFFFPF